MQNIHESYKVFAACFNIDTRKGSLVHLGLKFVCFFFNNAHLHKLLLMNVRNGALLLRSMPKAVPATASRKRLKYLI